jgi:hypothetical protein
MHDPSPTPTNGTFKPLPMLSNMIIIQ